MTVDTLDRPASSALLAQPGVGHFIDGREETDGEAFPVLNPATGEEIARCAAGTAETVDRAVASARAAFDDGRWRLLPAKEKEARLRAYARLVERHADDFVHLDVVDGGLLAGYSRFVVQFSVDMINYYAGWPTKLHGSVPSVSPDLLIRQLREPIGVCGIILPWNGPSFTAGFVTAALACGNSVVLKPAEQTPLSAILSARLALEAGIPAGVFNVVQGPGGITGDALVRHRDIGTISFTGSSATGRRIQAAAAENLTPVAMELGGKSPHIVFADADIEAAAQTVAAAVWGHCGQVCTAGTRVLVERSIHDRFAARVVELSRGLKVGPGDDPASQIGPLISQAQFDRVTSYMQLGRQEGASLLLGGNRVGDRGYFVEPTIFGNVTNDMRIAREEIFGPVMSLLMFDSDEQALAIANDSAFGLAAGIWTRDLDRANRFSDRLRAGTVWINSYQLVDPAVSYGGHKGSGFGRNLGEESLDHYLQTKSVWIRTPAQ
jgi:acyl-CoA reductase-like NAD-dependent aldehyde dehydrogenase